MRQRRWQQPLAGFQLARCGLGEDPDVGGSLGPHAVPQPTVAREVVIAGKQPPRARIALHSRHRLNDHAVFGTFGVEDVAGYENMRGLVLSRGLAECVDRVEARLGQGSTDVAVEASVRLAELPVGGVDQA